MIPPQTSFKILEANKGNICDGVSISTVIGGWIGQFNFLKRNATKDILPIIFQNFLNSSFFNISWKKIFFWNSDTLDCSAVVLENKRQFRKDFYKILEHYFLSGHFQNTFVVQSLTRW